MSFGDIALLVSLFCFSALLFFILKVIKLKSLRLQVFLTQISFFVILYVVIFLVFYENLKQYYNDEYDKKLFRIADDAALSATMYGNESVLPEGKYPSKIYENQVNRFMEYIRNNKDIQCMYTLKIKNNQLCYILYLDANPLEKSSEAKTPNLLGQEYRESKSDKIFDVFFGNELKLIRLKKGKTIISYYVPVIYNNSIDTIVGMDVEHTPFFFKFKLFSLKLYILYLIPIFLVFLFSVYISNLFMKPLLQFGKQLDILDLSEDIFPVEKKLYKEFTPLITKTNLFIKRLKFYISQHTETETALEYSERKYKELTSLLPQTIFETDFQGNLLFVNRSGLDIFGYTEGELKAGKNALDMIHPDEKKKAFENIQKILRGENVINNEYKAVKKDGTPFPILIYSSPIYRSTVPIGLRGIIIDITAQKKAEEELIQAQKMEIIGTLSGGLAHDFNNVLGGILGILALMQSKIKNHEQIPEDEIKEFIDIMQESGIRAKDLVQQLLSVSRKKDFDLYPVNLNQSVEHVMKICENTFDKSIKLDVKYYGEKALIQADSTQIEQAFLNLCVNASHAMTIMLEEEKFYGGLLKISIDKISKTEISSDLAQGTVDCDYWKIAFEDTGIGMDEKTLNKIFDPFFTTKRKGVGTGLGLAMVYNIIKSHNGFISVHSELHKGSVFNIYIPVFKTEYDIDTEMNIEEEIPSGTGVILVVDDEPIIRYTAKNFLEKCGYDVLLAEDGIKAVNLFRERHRQINAVLLDLVMPNKSGRETLVDIKSIDRNCPVILTSGFDINERINAMLNMGANIFLQKPYSMKTLANAIKKVVSGLDQSFIN